MTCKIEQIFIFGSTGMLGNYISAFFSKKSQFKVININFRITNTTIHDLENVLIQNGIDDKTCIINCIGQIPQRNQDNKTYILVNSIFPHLLWNICTRHGSKMIQPTTDCVFSGRRIEGNYTENDNHDEDGLYGMSKSLGEPYDCTIIRTSIIGREIYNKKSFLEWVITNGENNGEINGWSNHYWNGITCLEYSKLIFKIINENLFWTGVRHISSPNAVSKYELASFIRDVFGLNLKINKVECSEIINKTLKSNYENIYNIKDLFGQIMDLKTFNLV